MVIRPERGWEPANPRELWRFRDLFRTLAGRDVKLRYRQTIFGITWDLLQTLVPVTIFSVIVGGVGNVRGVTVPYFLFAFVGFLGYNAFANTVFKASNSIVADSTLLARVYFPRLILPLATMVSTFVDFTITLGALPVLMFVFKFHPPLAIVLLPLWLGLITLLALSLGLYAAAMMVTYRDVKYAVPVLLQFLFYATPVAYPIPLLPANLRPWFHLNPVANILDGLRWSLLGTQRPTPGYMIYTLAFTVVAAVWGLVVFNRLQRRFADVI